MSEKNTKIKAVIFDCFGVLAEDGWLPFKREFIGDNKDLADQVAELGRQNDYGKITADEYFDRASRLIGVQPKILRDAVGRQVPNVELIKFIKNELKPKYKIGLLSNANYDVVSDLFTPSQVSLFDATALSYQDKLVKPDPRMFELIASRLEVDMHECIFVDDVERYCIAAQALGMSAILYENQDRLQIEILQHLNLG